MGLLLGNRCLIKYKSVSRKDLELEWLFNGNTLDTSINGFDAEVNTGVLTQNHKSEADKAYDYNGIDQDTRKSYEPELADNDIFSLSLWFKLKSWSGSVNAWVQSSWGDFPTFNRFGLFFRSGDPQRLRFSYYGGSGSNIRYGSSVDITLGQWYYVTAIHGASDDKIYIDGVLDSSASYEAGSFEAGITKGGNPGFVIAARANFIQHADIAATLIRLYSRELDSSEIEILADE
jgi:hypothetical protein